MIASLAQRQIHDAGIVVAHQIGAVAIAYAASEMHNWFDNDQAAFMTSGVLWEPVLRAEYRVLG